MTKVVRSVWSKDAAVAMAIDEVTVSQERRKTWNEKFLINFWWKNLGKLVLTSRWNRIFLRNAQFFFSIFLVQVIYLCGTSQNKLAPSTHDWPTAKVTALQLESHVDSWSSSTLNRLEILAVSSINLERELCCLISDFERHKKAKTVKKIIYIKFCIGTKRESRARAEKVL